MIVANKSLFIEDLSGNNSEAQRGSVLRRRIVVKNLDDRDTEVDVWIVATNKKSEPLLRWCTFSEQNPIRLKPREDREITLSFEVPQQAPADVYHYEILVDAQTQYPNQPPIRRPQQLRVLPSAQDAEWGTEPNFSLQPVTHSANPYRLQAGEQLEIQMTVKNCSKRVDRFYLTCPELTKEWFTVHYPESNLETPGLVRETDGLELNPGNIGEIVLRLHPPQYTLAGNYFPTLRLTSSNKENLVLLDVVYLQILPSDQLNVQLSPTLRKVPSEQAAFAIELTNQGNIKRSILLQATDQANLFGYTLNPASVNLSPGITEQIHLTAKPQKWWRRPLRGKGWEIPVDLILNDSQPALSLSVTQSPASSPQNIQATILWEPRPWWFLWLLALLGLGAIGTLALLIWLTFFKPTPIPSPKITQFDNAVDPVTKQKQRYRAGDSRAIHLDWQIKHLDKVNKVTVIQMEKGQERNRRSFDFAGKVPTDLQLKRQDGYCQKVKIANTDGLDCKGIAIPITAAGEYTFQLQVFTSPDQKQPADSITADTITVDRAPLPQIVELSPTKPLYRLSTTTQSNSSPTGPIQLNWQITNASQIKELTLIGLAADGSIGSQSKRYTLTGNNLPQELSEYCTMATNLTCRNVPTPAKTAGSYSFKLAVVPKQEPSTSIGPKEIEKSTPLIKIQPSSPKIISFQLNGQEVNLQPKTVIELNKNRPLTQAIVSWQVEKADGIKVELLPAPGIVPLQGNLHYPLSKAPNRETLTLKVTNQLGEEVTRTIVLETIEPKAATPPPASNSVALESSSDTPSNLPSPSPSSDQLQPIESSPKPIP